MTHHVYILCYICVYIVHCGKDFEALVIEKDVYSDVILGLLRLHYIYENIYRITSSPFSILKALFCKSFYCALALHNYDSDLVSLQAAPPDPLHFVQALAFVHHPFSIAFLQDDPLVDGT